MFYQLFFCVCRTFSWTSKLVPNVNNTLKSVYFRKKKLFKVQLFRSLFLKKKRSNFWRYSRNFYTKKTFWRERKLLCLFHKNFTKKTPWMILLYIAFSIIGYRLDLKNLILLKDLVTFCEHFFFCVFFKFGANLKVR